jgi:hypothetical protein
MFRNTVAHCFLKISERAAIKRLTIRRGIVIIMPRLFIRYDFRAAAAKGMPVPAARNNTLWQHAKITFENTLDHAP